MVDSRAGSAASGDGRKVRKYSKSKKMGACQRDAVVNCMAAGQNWNNLSKNKNSDVLWGGIVMWNGHNEGSSASWLCLIIWGLMTLECSSCENSSSCMLNDLFTFLLHLCYTQS